MRARYRFAVRFRIDPEPVDVTVDPAAFDTAFYKSAEPPGEEGWLFFRDRLWRGEVGEHARPLFADALGVEVDHVEFRAFEVDREYLRALREAIADDLEAFRADSVEEVLTKYLGSAIEVRETDELDDAQQF